MDPDRRDEIPIGPDLTALERRLSGWQPAAGTLDRARMLYDAGRAAAGAGARPWRLMAASLLLAALGLAGLLAHQHSSLDRERALLAQERAKSLRLETALAARTGAAQPTLPSAVPHEAIEPPAPSSYLALTARLAAGADDPAPPLIIDDPEPPAPAPAPERGPARPSPIRPHDLRRVLDL